ncbi:glycosyltransferase [Agrococcus terreus]|uniref:Peptidase M14 n=1 Tax=Agrococcus terreus TaxID=574649 RepID=A0ABQ2KFH9_9MICO|nr:glycosyltransferase [Agrococcus terreus]GGN80320.1 peptidase M14 [Agrococcus terreus]
MRVVVFPAYRENPFLGMLLSGAKRDGAEIVDTRTLDELAAALAVRPESTVLSVHWTNPVAQSTRNPAIAVRNALQFRRILRSAKAAGAHVVWTVHNVLPHGARFPRIERWLHRLLAAQADRIHVMHPDTAALTAPHYRLPDDRVRLVPHPSYVGAVGPRADREVERARLGLGAREAAVLLLGQMRPYKGVLELIDAAGAAHRPGGLTLLLAGNATPDEAAAIEAAIAARPGLRAVCQLRYIDDAELPRWFAAADVVALPYRRILNSGSALLAATFGTPVLLPDEPHLADLGAHDWVTLFSGADGLRAALEAVRVDDAAARASAIAFASTWTGEDAGDAYRELLHEALVS